MRLTVNLEDDLYAVAKAFAREGDSTVSAAINQLIRRGLEPVAGGAARKKSRSSLPAVRCRKTFTSEDVYRIDSELA